MTATCPECQVVRGTTLPLGLAALARGAFLIHPRIEPAAHPGWMLVVPRRHVEQVAELTDVEARQLGPLLRETAAALRAETGAERTYVACFAEVVPHLHFHVIARAAQAPEETRGARAFLADAAHPTGAPSHTELLGESPAEGGNEAEPDAGARQDLACRVLARLAAGEAATRWRPLLLSALLWPGAGQIVAGRAVFGWTVAAATATAGVLMLRTLVVETLTRIPTAGVYFDDFGSLIAHAQRLATEIRPGLSPYLWTLVGLWAIGCVEAIVTVLSERR